MGQPEFSRGTPRSIHENAGSTHELFAAGGKMSFSEMADDEFMFETDSSGHVTQMVLSISGKEIPLKRID